MNLRKPCRAAAWDRQLASCRECSEPDPQLNDRIGANGGCLLRQQLSRTPLRCGFAVNSARASSQHCRREWIHPSLVHLRLRSTRGRSWATASLSGRVAKHVHTCQARQSEAAHLSYAASVSDNNVQIPQLTQRRARMVDAHNIQRASCRPSLQVTR